MGAWLWGLLLWPASHAALMLLGRWGEEAWFCFTIKRLNLSESSCFCVFLLQHPPEPGPWLFLQQVHGQSDKKTSLRLGGEMRGEQSSEQACRLSRSWKLTPRYSARQPPFPALLPFLPSAASNSKLSASSHSPSPVEICSAGPRACIHPPLQETYSPSACTASQPSLRGKGVC